MIEQYPMTVIPMTCMPYNYLMFLIHLTTVAIDNVITVDMSNICATYKLFNLIHINMPLFKMYTFRKWYFLVAALQHNTLGNHGHEHIQYMTLQWKEIKSSSSFPTLPSKLCCQKSSTAFLKN